MQKNKVTTYLLYAIGEIVLVVIGILIAVSINNWNEQQKDRVEERKILAELRNEFRANLMQLDQKITMRNQMMDAASLILNYADHPEIAKHDSLMWSFGVTLKDPTFDPIKNDLISSGKIRLLQNDSLRLMLSNWTSDVFQLQEIELEWQKVRTEIGCNIALRLGITRDYVNQLWKDGYTPLEALDTGTKVTLRQHIGKSANPPNLNEILRDSELEGHAANVIMWSQVGNIQSEALDNRIRTILDLIEKDLNQQP
jgi:hypothetical protein